MKKYLVLSVCIWLTGCGEAVTDNAAVALDYTGDIAPELADRVQSEVINHE